MPANKNAMTRYKILDELLSNRYHNYSLDDLTEEVSNRLVELDPSSDGVIRRTIEKDIHYLEYESPFMVEIERYTEDFYNSEKKKTTKKYCLRYANRHFSIFKKEMTDDEEYLLGEAMNMLGQFDGLPNLDALEGLHFSLGLKKSKRQIISFTKNPLENSNILGELFTAISQKQVIELCYHKFSSPDDELQIILHPYLLKEYNRRWYLIARAESDGKMLCFALDRIDKAIPLPAYKYKEFDGDILERFEDIIGVTYIKENPIQKIVFWTSDTSKDYIATKPLHESQRRLRGQKEMDLRIAYPKLETGAFFQIECKENYELIRELTIFGKDLIVLEPSAIKAKVWQRVKSMYDAYNDIN